MRRLILPNSWTLEVLNFWELKRPMGQWRHSSERELSKNRMARYFGVVASACTVRQMCKNIMPPMLLYSQPRSSNAANPCYCKFNLIIVSPSVFFCKKVYLLLQPIPYGRIFDIPFCYNFRGPQLAAIHSFIHSFIYLYQAARPIKTNDNKQAVNTTSTTSTTLQ